MNRSSACIRFSPGAELAAHLAARGEVGARGQEALLAYYTRTGRVVRVRRGLYAVIPPGADPASYPVDPRLVAAKLTPDAVVAEWNLVVPRDVLERSWGAVL